MSERLKQILFVVFFAVFTIGIAVGIYFVFFREAPTSLPVPSEEPSLPGGVLPGAGPAATGTGAVSLPPGAFPTAGTVAFPGEPGTAAPAQTVLLRDGVTEGVSPSSDGKGARFYNPDDDKFYRVNPDGSSLALSDDAFPNLETVSWGKNSDQAILSFPDGSNVHYDFRTRAQTTLPKHWGGFDFAPDDAQVVAKSEAISPASRFLIVTDPDGRNSKAIELLGENADKTFPAWTPNNQIIAYAMVGEAKGLDREEILMIGKNHENFRGLQVEGRGFRPLWSPSGRTIIYSVWSVATEYRPELWISGGDPDTLNQGRRKLDIQTWADKCVWGDEETVYCAVPERLPRGSGLQQDLFNNIPDAFIKIDLRSGAKIPLGSPEGGLSVRNPVITDDGQHIIFTDALTGRLYDFTLP